MSSESPILSHLDGQGRAVMVDVSEKAVTTRTASAIATVYMKPETLRLIRDNQMPKGDVFAASRIAGIMAAKNTAGLIPLCHPLPISSVRVEFAEKDDPPRIDVITTVKVHAQTGVEMEALTGSAVAALTIYDMCKAIDKAMRVEGIMLLQKHGGRSGSYIRADDQ